MARICKVIFSTNRLEYLTKTLKAQQKIDWTGHEVDGLFFDDYPKGRNDPLVDALVRAYGYTEVYLHKENKGLSTTWKEFWDLIKTRNYDYIWQTEDDVEVLYPFRITDLINLLIGDPQLSQVGLKRQKWYSTEEETCLKGSDWMYMNYRYEKDHALFSPMATLYPIERTRIDYRAWYQEHYPETNWENISYNEGMVGKALHEGFGLVSGLLKNQQGQPMIHHIGEFFVGKRVLPHEPGYEKFAQYDPEKKYFSRDGSDYVE